MSVRTAGLLKLSAAVFLLSAAVLGQITVDATRPRGKLRDTVGGSGGGVGRKLPFQVAVEIQGAPFNGKDGKTVLEFILTNSGKAEVMIPVSPNPGDMGSADSFRELALYMTFGKKDDPWGKDRQLLQAGADPHNPFVFLYGSDAVPGTLSALAPGESVHVRAEIAIPHVSVTDLGNRSFVAHAMMHDETMRTAEGKLLMDSREIGSATSPEYTLEALFKSPK